MTKSNPPSDVELREAIKNLVMDILARGRLNQKELDGILTVRDMGINVRKNRFVNDILLLFQTHHKKSKDKLIADLRSRLPKRSRIGKAYSTSAIDRISYDMAFNNCLDEVNAILDKIEKGE